MVIKQVLALIILSFIVLFANSALNAMLHSLIDLHQWISDLLSSVFKTSNHIGDAIQQVLTLLLVPCLFAGIPALIYWAMKRATMPYICQIIWGVWLIQAVVITLTSRLFVW